MSEFTCSQGHLIRPSVGYCEVCGGRAVRMDGMSARQLEAMDRDFAEEEARNKNESSEVENEL